MAVSSGVFPCYENAFTVETGASETGASTMSPIADCESFSVSIDNGVEEWTPFTTDGWVRRLQTAKSISISVSAKRNIGDVGNDFIAGLSFLSSRDVEADFLWTLPDGATLLFTDAVISVTNNGGGDSTAVAPLEFEVLSNGKPTYTPA